MWAAYHLQGTSWRGGLKPAPHFTWLWRSPKHLQQFRMTELPALAVAPATIFERARGHPALGYDNAMRNADQLDVGEHRARPQPAIVEHGVDAVRAQFRIERFGGLGDFRIALRVDDADRCTPRCDRLR